MSLPSSLAEYEVRFREHVESRREGGQMVLSIPCPFCASKDWHVASVEEFQHSTSAIYCSECERSARFVCSSGGEQIELLQVAGPDAPEWLPQIRHENPPVVSRSAGHLEPRDGRRRGQIR